MSVSTATRPRAIQRRLFHTTALTCDSCGGPDARERAPLAAGASALTVCDACWTAAGAAESDEPAADPGQILGIEAGELHPLDQLVVRAGLRWARLRWVATPVRRQLAAEVAEREAAPPAETRPADSGVLWLDAVRAVVQAAGFRRDRCEHILAVAHGLVRLVEHEGRPLTWVTQGELAAEIGITDRTVRAHVGWLRRCGLLHELMGGRRAPVMSRPVDETPAEAEARRQAEQDAQAHEDSRIEAARAILANHRERAAAELSAVREGHAGQQAVLLAAEAVPETDIEIPDSWAGSTRPLLNIAPVYELRVPLTPAEAAERHQAAAARSSVPSAKKINFHPPSGSSREGGFPDAYGVVESGGASRRCRPKGVDPSQSGADLAAAGSKGTSRGDHPAKPSSRAQKAAEVLLRSLLRPEVVEGVSIRWLTARLRGSGLLDAGWTDQDLADQIHGWHDRPQLPRHIHNPRGWITARLGWATPALPPSRLAQIAEAEAVEGEYRRQVRTAATARIRREENVQRRAAIDACSLCDEVGWLEVADPAVQATRCNHDPDTGGW